MGLLGPAGNAGARRRGRRRGLVVGAAVGSAAARRSNSNQPLESEAPVQQGPSDSMQQMAELEKLGQLKASGVLTQEEFDAKKKEILNS